DLTNTIGSFQTNSNAITIEITKDNKIILAQSGEESSSNIDSEEVFKLKRDPLLTVLPSDGDYGDDLDTQAISTFGAPNQWMDDGVLKTQNFNALRENRDLNEVDGIALSHIEAFDGLKDSESILYVAPNNSLWIADDNAHSVYEMDLTTKEVKAIYTRDMLEELSGICRDENGEEIEDCDGLDDLESVVYDDVNDILYIFVGSTSSIPAIFKLTRESIDGTFVLDDEDENTIDFRILDSEYQAAQYIDGEMIVSIDYDLYSYDFETDTHSSTLFTATGDEGNVYGMAYDEGGNAWMVTSKNYLIKIDWATKVRLASYKIADDDSILTYNGVYDTRGLEIIDDKLYILEGMNSSGTDDVAVAPYGSALKNSVHIYDIPSDNL
ncbi:hypothetical protein GSY74_00575, partial [Sulfurovum sp. bin170]|uniref:hypothetical protein n=1 Tax=Sulfurovum sp. bin170 TaxID=2695268 RepID=UPI0013DF9DC8